MFSKFAEINKSSLEKWRVLRKYLIAKAFCFLWRLLPQGSLHRRESYISYIHFIN